MQIISELGNNLGHVLILITLLPDLKIDTVSRKGAIITQGITAADFEHVKLFEKSFVQQQFVSLPGRRLSPLVLPLYPFGFAQQGFASKSKQGL